MKLDKSQIEKQVSFALAEDLGDKGDITAAIIAEDRFTEAHLYLKQEAILCGEVWFTETFTQLSNNIDLVWFFHDGVFLKKDTQVCTIQGPAGLILSGERTAINFLQTLSAVATQANYFQKLIEETGSNTKILDTRKTIPGLRYAQKYAVTCGGALNHRMGLFDQILIKENHIKACGGISNSINRARNLHGESIFIEIEVENIIELKEALDANANQILLDNFSPSMVNEAVKLRDQSYDSKLEVSGNIDETNLAKFAISGIDYISMGSITKNIKAIDFSLIII
jgi:nicotinate-nucleotide pyrophosphorylase (carboxylating)